MRDGWGFAASPRFAGSILLGKRSVGAAGFAPGALLVGDTVEFEVAPSASGSEDKFEAVSIRKMAIAGPSFPAVAPYPVIQARNPVYAAAPPMAYGAMMACGGAGYRGSPYAATAPPSSPNGKLPGIVKTFRDGWGFILSDYVPGDIFVSTQNCPGTGGYLEPGESVVFDVAYKSANGRNNGASAFNVVRAAPPNVPHRAPAGSLRPSFPAPAMRPRQPLGPPRFAPPAAPQSSGQRVRGTVTLVKDIFAFAESPGVDGWILLGTKNLVAAGLDASLLQVGDVVEFELATAAKGYEALAIQRL